jgi:hypothetical protein
MIESALKEQISRKIGKKDRNEKDRKELLALEQ